MSKRLFMLIPALIVAAVVAGALSGQALAWNAKGVKVSVDCDTSSYTYNVSAEVVQSDKYPGAFVKSVTPDSFPGNTSGEQNVRVVVGWSNSNDTQTFKTSVKLAGDCVKPKPKDCPAGYSKDSGSNEDMLLCTRTVTNTVTNTVTVYGNPTCPQGTKEVGRGEGSVVCERIVYGQPGCPADTKETSRGEGSVVCERTITVVKEKLVYGKPTCPKKFKQLGQGKGWVTCGRTFYKNKTKVKVVVRVVQQPKLAHTK